jgi:hypothetical protein
MDVLARVDDAAIDQPCHHRRELSADDRQHRFVPHAETLPDPPLLHQGPALQMTGADDQVDVVEACADRACARGGCLRRVDPALGEVLLCGSQQEIAMLDTIA